LKEHDDDDDMDLLTAQGARRLATLTPRSFGLVWELTATWRCCTFMNRVNPHNDHDDSIVNIVPI